MELVIEEARYDGLGDEIVGWENPIPLAAMPWPPEVQQAVRDGFHPDGTLSKEITIADVDYRVSFDPGTMREFVAQSATACHMGRNALKGEPVSDDTLSFVKGWLHDAKCLLAICYTDPIILRRLQWAYEAPGKKLPWNDPELPQISDVCNQDTGERL